MTVVFPLGLWFTSIIFDVIYTCLHTPFEDMTEEEITPDLL